MLRRRKKTTERLEPKPDAGSQGSRETDEPLSDEELDGVAGGIKKVGGGTVKGERSLPSSG